MPELFSFAGHSPAVSQQAWLAPNVVLVGDVKLAAGVSVFFGAVLRADTASISIAERSNVQDNVVIHADPGYDTTVGAGVSVGHSAVLHGCSIGDGSIIGMNATVLNGAVIGEQCLIAAGAVVREGQVIAPGSLVAGVPAVVRRPLTEEERLGLSENAHNYFALAKKYAELTV